MSLQRDLNLISKREGRNYILTGVVIRECNIIENLFRRYPWSKFPSNVIFLWRNKHLLNFKTILAILRRSDYCISGNSSVDVKDSTEDHKKWFRWLSLEERGKLDEDELFIVTKSIGFKNEYIVEWSQYYWLLKEYTRCQP